MYLPIRAFEESHLFQIVALLLTLGKSFPAWLLNCLLLLVTGYKNDPFQVLQPTFDTGCRQALRYSFLVWCDAGLRNSVFCSLVGGRSDRF